MSEPVADAAVAACPEPEQSEIQVIPTVVEVEIARPQNAPGPDETLIGCVPEAHQPDYLQSEDSKEQETETSDGADTETSEDAEHGEEGSQPLGEHSEDIEDEHSEEVDAEGEHSEEAESEHTVDVNGDEHGTAEPQTLVAAPADAPAATEEPPPVASGTSESDTDSSAPKVNRELMALLALSKEARLDTNLTTHRRKTLDSAKTVVKEKGPPTVKDATPKKTPKVSNFPVTAESELEELDAGKREEKGADEKSPKKAVKKAKGEGGAEGAGGDGQPKKGFSGRATMLKPNKDMFCWRCHHDAVTVACETCPRAYHQKCLKQTITDTEHWPCPECVAILKAENTQTRSKAMKGMTLEHLCSLLKFAVKRMIQCDGTEPFMHPVDEKQFPEYKNYIIQPMSLTMLEKNIKENLYGSTQAFEADAKWILHNSIVFNSSIVLDQSKLTTAAKTIVKICKQEMAEIENCPSCYLNANTKKHTWFVEVCPKPHLLVWAKLKGFPYWPAKVMSFNTTGMVDVRFFGAHDKAWVSVKDCFMYSHKDPNAGKQKRNDIIECVKELEVYVENLKKMYGRVNYAPPKMLLEAAHEQKYLKMFLPMYNVEGGRGRKEPVSRGGGGGGEEEKKEKVGHREATQPVQSDEGEGCDNDESESEKDGESDSSKERSPDESDLKIVPKTRIEYRHNSGKPRWVVKPLKTIVIRKRHSLDNIADHSARKIARRNSEKFEKRVQSPLTKESKKSESKRKEEPDKTEDKKAGKLKITHQLIKKLADIEDKEETKEKDEEKPSEVPKENKAENVSDKTEKMVEIENKANGEVSNDEKKQPEKESSQVKEDSLKVVAEDKATADGAEVEAMEVVESPREEKNKSKEVNGKALLLPEPIEIDDEKSTDAETEGGEVEIDETNIRNIIHSSLIKPIAPAVAKDVVPDIVIIEEKEDDGDKGVVEEKTKRKRMLEEKLETFPPNKMVKLVPIENILQKKNDDGEVAVVEKEKTNKPAHLVVLKEIRVVKEGKEVKHSKSNKVETNAKPPVEVKNEAESEGEDDVQYMEAKRQYMSALNISERQKVPAKPKQNEIRTRSKTEEKRSKSVDNASKVIDDVATQSTSEGEARKAPPPQSEAPKEIYIKSLSKMQAPKHKARKSFPTPNYNKRPPVVSKTILPKPPEETAPATPTTTATIRVINTNALQTFSSAGNIVFLPKLHYTKPPPLSMASDIVTSPMLIMAPRQVSTSQVITSNTVVPSQVPQTVSPGAVRRIATVVDGSQNYIPQSEGPAVANGNGGATVSNPPPPSLLNNLLVTGSTVTASLPVDEEAVQPPIQVDSELGALKDILPESVVKEVGEILCQPPPKLKPKPFGVLNTVCDAGVPSTAGPTASRINSVAQKLTDYFRGLMVEAITDLGKSNNSEATISSLKMDIEELNHRHSIELTEIRRNVSIVLKDIQKSIVEERERIVNETKASFEMDAQKRVEEAKSKQWCANCLKEAQFYCCWNTSYCDYPCQQKHWPKHMSKCTQSGNQAQGAASASPAARPSGGQQQLVLTPTAPPKFGTLFAKPQKVYLKRANTPFKQSPTGHITLVESTPGNFELVGSGPIAVNGKILASTSVIEKIKSANIVTVSAPSGGASTESTSANQKVTLTPASKTSVLRNSAGTSDSEH